MIRFFLAPGPPGYQHGPSNEHRVVTVAVPEVEALMGTHHIIGVEWKTAHAEPAPERIVGHEFVPTEPTLKSEKQAAKLGNFPAVCSWRPPGGAYRCGQPKSAHQPAPALEPSTSRRKP